MVSCDREFLVWFKMEDFHIWTCGRHLIWQMDQLLLFLCWSPFLKLDALSLCTVKCKNSHSSLTSSTHFHGILIDMKNRDLQVSHISVCVDFERLIDTFFLCWQYIWFVQTKKCNTNWDCEYRSHSFKHNFVVRPHQDLLQRIIDRSDSEQWSLNDDEALALLLLLLVRVIKKLLMDCLPAWWLRLRWWIAAKTWSWSFFLSFSVSTDNMIKRWKIKALWYAVHDNSTQVVFYKLKYVFID